MFSITETALPPAPIVGSIAHVKAFYRPDRLGAKQGAPLPCADSHPVGRRRSCPLIRPHCSARRAPTAVRPDRRGGATCDLAHSGWTARDGCESGRTARRGICPDDRTAMRAKAVGRSPLACAGSSWLEPGYLSLTRSDPAPACANLSLPKVKTFWHSASADGSAEEKACIPVEQATGAPIIAQAGSGDVRPCTRTMSWSAQRVRLSHCAAVRRPDRRGRGRSSDLRD